MVVAFDTTKKKNSYQWMLQLLNILGKHFFQIGLKECGLETYSPKEKAGDTGHLHL